MAGSILRADRGSVLASAEALQERLKVDDYLALREAALLGVGIAVISDLLVKKELADGGLVRVFERWKLPAGHLWAVYPSRGKIPAKTEGMLRALADGFTAADPPNAGGPRTAR